MVHKILLVDANRSVCAIHSAALVEAGYDVATAHEMGMLSAKLGCGALSLVVAELTLPGSSSNDPLCLVRKVLTLRPGVPLLVLTSNSNRAAHREARKIGVWDICIKPTSCSDLLSLTKNILADVYPAHSDHSPRLFLDHPTGA